ncbi:lipase family protein [Pseudomonadota bacterium]
MVDPINLFDNEKLLGVPVMRAAYSDRTAWLMSCMSELAYYPFEGNDRLLEIATELAKLSGVDEIKDKLSTLLSGTLEGGDVAALEKTLKLAGFDLINTYNRSETQAFLAKRASAKDGGDPGMLILAFRGTEMNARDIHTDLKAQMVVLEGEEKVHKGFLQAFRHVETAIKADLDAHPGIPVYITGHSLGGALAILGTRLLAAESQGACYTFGGPRVGTPQLDDEIKTPIYRVVNAADLVPRVPPSYLIGPLIMLANLAHLTFVVKFLRKYKGYVHFGDMRYLNHAEPGVDDKFKGLVLHANPSLIVRAGWVVRRWISTGGKAAVTDHSIGLYRRKLKAYALWRNAKNN